MFNRRDLYCYHSSTPAHLIEPEENKKDKNIFGLELECNDSDVWPEFSELVRNNIIAIPYNEDRYERKNVNIIGEEDCTAQFELVFQAERPRNLLLGLKAINSELNPDTVYNEDGSGSKDATSAHIHMNNQHLYNRGLTGGDIGMISEILAGALFTMSGRVDNGNSLYWGDSLLNKKGECNILAHPSKRARILSNYTPRDFNTNYHGWRYVMINTPTEHETTELRIFSNTCNFDYERIHLFLDTANFLIDMADKYQSYEITECYQDIVDDFKSFMTNNRRRREETKKLGLEFFWSDAKTYYNYMRREGYAPHDIELSDTVSVLRTLRDIERDFGIVYNGRINLNNTNIEEIEDFLENEVGYYNYILSR